MDGSNPVAWCIVSPGVLWLFFVPASYEGVSYTAYFASNVWQARPKTHCVVDRSKIGTC